jgi:hypothetical protein
MAIIGHGQNFIQCHPTSHRCEEVLRDGIEIRLELIVAEHIVFLVVVRFCLLNRLRPTRPLHLPHSILHEGDSFISCRWMLTARMAKLIRVGIAISFDVVLDVHVALVWCLEHLCVHIDKLHDLEPLVGLSIVVKLDPSLVATPRLLALE